MKSGLPAVRNRSAGATSRFATFVEWTATSGWRISATTPTTPTQEMISLIRRAFVRPRPGTCMSVISSAVMTSSTVPK